MRRSIDDCIDDHPADDDERPPAFWSVGTSDDCEGCSDLRVMLNLEEVGGAGRGLAAHLAPSTARRLRTALAAALVELGEDPGR